jgi:hypothetical protein
MFKYYVHNEGEIKSLKVTEVLESGQEVQRQVLMAKGLSAMELFSLETREFKEVSKTDAGHILKLLELVQTTDKIEEELTQNPYVVPTPTIAV